MQVIRPIRTRTSLVVFVVLVFIVPIFVPPKKSTPTTDRLSCVSLLVVPFPFLADILDGPKWLLLDSSMADSPPTHGLALQIPSSMSIATARTLLHPSVSWSSISLSELPISTPSVRLVGLFAISFFSTLDPCCVPDLFFGSPLSDACQYPK